MLDKALDALIKILDALRRFLNTLTPIWPLIFVLLVIAGMWSFRPSDALEKAMFLLIGAIIGRSDDTAKRRTEEFRRSFGGRRESKDEKDLEGSIS